MIYGSLRSLDAGPSTLFIMIRIIGFTFAILASDLQLFTHAMHPKQIFFKELLI